MVVRVGAGGRRGGGASTSSFAKGKGKTSSNAASASSSWTDRTRSWASRKQSFVSNAKKNHGPGTCWRHMQTGGHCPGAADGTCKFFHPYISIIPAGYHGNFASASAPTIVTLSRDVPIWRERILADRNFQPAEYPGVKKQEEVNEKPGARCGSSVTVTAPADEANTSGATDSENATAVPNTDEQCAFGQHRGKLFSQIVQTCGGYIDYCRQQVAQGRQNEPQVERLVAFADANRGIEVCTWGKHEGVTFERILQRSPAYVHWCRTLNNPDNDGMMRLLAYADTKIEGSLFSSGESMNKNNAISAAGSAGGAARDSGNHGKVANARTRSFSSGATMKKKGSLCVPPSNCVFSTVLFAEDAKKKLLDMFDGKENLFDFGNRKALQALLALPLPENENENINGNTDIATEINQDDDKPTATTNISPGLQENTTDSSAANVVQGKHVFAFRPPRRTATTAELPSLGAPPGLKNLHRMSSSFATTQSTTFPEQGASTSAANNPRMSVSSFQPHPPGRGGSMSSRGRPY